MIRGRHLSGILVRSRFTSGYDASDTNLAIDAVDLWAEKNKVTEPVLAAHKRNQSSGAEQPDLQHAGKAAFIDTGRALPIIARASSGSGREHARAAGRASPENMCLHGTTADIWRPNWKRLPQTSKA